MRDGDQPLFAIVAFRSVVAFYFGPPNDEGLGRHPLARFGLKWYSVFEVFPSPFLAQIGFGPSLWSSRKHHFIFTFQDSLFECIADEFIAQIFAEGKTNLRSAMVRRLPSP